MASRALEQRAQPNEIVLLPPGGAWTFTDVTNGAG